MTRHVARHADPWHTPNMQPSRSMSVSELKTKLLEVVRRVEQGEVIEITKDGEPVAVLAPRDTWNLGATGFGRVEMRGPLELPTSEWSYDLENLRARGKRRP
jgi:prevent-host-death family protein